MSFLVDHLLLEHDALAAKMESYRQYLESARSSFPPNAFDFATAAWHYDFSHHQSPHDAWVESVTIHEPSSGDRQQHRNLEITAVLLGAYHDGYIQLAYDAVRSYEFRAVADAQSTSSQRGHGDWLIDEIRLSNSNLVIHEVLFSHGGRWLIECEDIRYVWEPKQNL